MFFKNRQETTDVASFLIFRVVACSECNGQLRVHIQYITYYLASCTRKYLDLVLLVFRPHCRGP